MNHYQVLRKLSSSVKDDNIKSRIEDIRKSSSESVLIDLKELESILDYRKSAEKVELEDVSVERK